jgi:hypothetical protein
MKTSTGLFLAMPETHSLRKLYWQFFVTLTFQSDRLWPETRRCLMFSWLRGVAGSIPRTHFRRLLWVSRFERGRGLRGHFHLCIGGIPSPLATVDLCRQLELAWQNRVHARAEVLLYDHARDGVGYIMKVQTGASVTGTGHGTACQDDSDGDINPTLSNSLFETLRRGRM